MRADDAAVPDAHTDESRTCSCVPTDDALTVALEVLLRTNLIPTSPETKANRKTMTLNTDDTERR